MKELYEKGKGRSVRGFASTCGRRRCRSPRPNRKRGAKLDAYTEYIDVRVSEVLENCVALIVDEFGNLAVRQGVGYRVLHPGVSEVRERQHHTDVEQGSLRTGERAAGRHGDNDGDHSTDCRTIATFSTPAERATG